MANADSKSDAHVSLPAVFASLRHQFGSARGDYLYPRGIVGEQIGAALGIPAPTLQLPDGNALVSGCRPHSCDEKAAIIVAPDGTVFAAGLINFHCGARVCDAKPRLTIFVTRARAQPVLSQELQDWAARAANVGVTETRLVP